MSADNRQFFRDAAFALKGQSHQEFCRELGDFLSLYAEEAKNVTIVNCEEEGFSYWQVDLKDKQDAIHRFYIAPQEIQSESLSRFHIAVPKENKRLLNLLWTAANISLPEIKIEGNRLGKDSGLITLTSPAYMNFQQLDRQKFAFMLMSVSSRILVPASEAERENEAVLAMVTGLQLDGGFTDIFASVFGARQAAQPA